MPTALIVALRFLGIISQQARDLFGATVVDRDVLGDQLRAIFRAPEMVVKTFFAARAQEPTITEAEVRDALGALDPLWNELFPAEQARIVKLLVERVDLTADAAAIRIRTAGIEGIVSSLRQKP